LRGVEKDREESDILSEVRTLVDQGVIEITLLGQNVNAYKHGGFANLLRQVGNIEGLERLRFMSPHPRDFTDDVIEAMAETPTVMPHLHMPLQSGSDAILQSMRRSYRREKYMGIIDRVRKAIPDAGITTDIIVGFPGETESDFQQTLEVVEEARFTAAFSFQYSKRPGTPAATMPNQIDDQTMADRYQRLHALQQRISGEINKESIGKSYELLVTENRDTRTPDFRLVHLPESATARVGDIVTAKIVEASPNFMIAGEISSVRATQGGDAHEARMAEVGPEPIMIGMPSLQKLKLIHGS
jgi:tRNA-2-methylthio-N6-dimethylallyladenosine synthase